MRVPGRNWEFIKFAFIQFPEKKNLPIPTQQFKDQYIKMYNLEIICISEGNNSTVFTKKSQGMWTALGNTHIPQQGAPQRHGNKPHVFFGGFIFLYLSLGYSYLIQHIWYFQYVFIGSFHSEYETIRTFHELGDFVLQHVAQASVPLEACEEARENVPVSAFQFPVLLFILDSCAS